MLYPHGESRRVLLDGYPPTVSMNNGAPAAEDGSTEAAEDEVIVEVESTALGGDREVLGISMPKGPVATH